MVWGCFKAEGKSPYPFIFFIIQTSFPICSILALRKSALSLLSAFPLFPFLPHAAILPLRWRDVVSKTPVVCQLLSKQLAMTELRVWVLARRVQAVQEQVAAGGEDKEDFNMSHLTSVFAALCCTTWNHWLAHISFFFFVLNQMSNVKSQLRKERSILTQGSSPSLTNGAPPVNLSSWHPTYQQIKGPPLKKTQKKTKNTSMTLVRKKKLPPQVCSLSLYLSAPALSLSSPPCVSAYNGDSASPLAPLSSWEPPLSRGQERKTASTNNWSRQIKVQKSALDNTRLGPSPGRPSFSSETRMITTARGNLLEMLVNKLLNWLAFGW